VPRRLVVEQVPPSGLRVYRIVTTADRESGGWLRSFESSYERGVAPRPASPEEAFRAIYMGISVFERCGQAMAVARRFPRIGSYVAQLDLSADEGFSFARWGPKGHLTVWGAPAKLASAVVKVDRVRD
jgi:hypothetical protein